jgi:cellulose biosynthesis protein BcsQ
MTLLRRDAVNCPRERVADGALYVGGYLGDIHNKTNTSGGEMELSAWSDFLKLIFGKIIERTNNDADHFAAWVVAFLLLMLLNPVRRWCWRATRSTLSWLTQVWMAKRRIDRALEAVGPESRGIWLSRPSLPRHTRKDLDVRMRAGPRVMVCANLKGGVGKTTVGLSLAACFASRSEERGGKPVLAIDLDFQGSMSSMAFVGEAWKPGLGDDSRASAAISGAKDGRWIIQASQPVVGVRHLHGLSAFYDLARTENRLQVQWLLEENPRDMRYFLAELLFSEAVRNTYDLVIIDAPPRLTTACVQALCASTHLLIPTVLDDLSADAVGNFGEQLCQHEELWPNLKVLGVLGTMTSKTDDGRDPSKEGYETGVLRTATDALRENLRSAKGPIRVIDELPYRLSIPDRAALGRGSGQGIAYATTLGTAQNRALRGMFDCLAETLEERIRRYDTC